MGTGHGACEAWVIYIVSDSFLLSLHPDPTCDRTSKIDDIYRKNKWGWQLDCFQKNKYDDDIKQNV
ncbi:hypothetical protein D3C87_347970 [compost metagenome]